MKKILVIALLIGSLVVAGCSQTKQAALSNDSKATAAAEKKPKSDYPNKPIEVVVPYAAGSSTEMVARIVGAAAEKHLPNKQSIVIVNKPGGSGTIGLTEVFRAKPDGYTLGITTNGQISMQPNYGKTVYTHDSFQPIVQASLVPMLLAVKSDAPWKTFEEWVEWAKKNPGKFTHATSGAGSAPHVSIEAVAMSAGVQTKAVHFEGGSQQITAILGGNVLGASILPQTAKEYVKSGDIRILANLGSYKPEALKDIPLLKEKGIGASVDIVTGFIAPKGLPKDVLDTLHQAFKKALEDPQVIADLKKIDVDAAYKSPEDYQKEITDGFNHYGKILKQIGLVQ